ncbi:MAG: alpha-glucosidase C-terminal domain-containing protein [Bacteroidia bacterium]|nr:alpha-glucosidase C-terminal domain-containing protein [Bacteroidia bacterium]MCZ2249024.1 alpha-amylase [Bacteroidia bacterium]
MMNRKLIFILTGLLSIALWLVSCKQDNHLNVPSQIDITDNIIPISLEPQQTIIHTNDILMDESLLDSVSARPFLNTKISDDKKHITLSENGTPLPPLLYLKIYCRQYEYSVLLKRSQKVSYEFKFVSLDTIPHKVQIAGDFNGWNPKNTLMLADKNGYKCNIVLNPGKYAYQLVVDDKWMLDPANPQKIDNNMGGFNSVINIGQKKNEKLPKLFTLGVVNNMIRIKTLNKPKKFFVLWSNFDLTDKFTKYQDDIIEIKIPDEAYYVNKSTIRVFSYNDDGTSNDILIPIKNGNVVKNIADIDRYDKAAMIMYFLMVDRFFDGDKNNNYPVNDKEVDFKANYQGGDLAGIDQKIKQGYFDKLSVNTLWISPIVQNPQEAYIEYPAPHRKYSGYHGYWPVSSSKIDYRFGDDNTLQTTIDDAHNKNINILIDFVSNHVHEKHPLYQQHKDWTTPLVLPDGRKNIRLWDEERLTTWFDTFLPDIDYSKPEVVSAMSDSAMFWINKFGIDGFRHDATKHVSEDFWRALTLKIKKYARDKKVNIPYQIGETFGSRDLIRSYVNSGEQNAQFDFNLYFDMRNVFLNDNLPFTNLSASLNESFDYYGWHSLMGNISGNHDLPRFIAYAGEDLKMNEDEKEAGWTRNIKVINKIGYKKLSQLMAYIATIPGVPVIYYGDEIGMPGAGDPDNRRMMVFDNLNTDQQNQFEITQQLFSIRKNNMSLLYGDYDLLKSDKNVMAYGRYYFDNAAFVFFNKDSKSVKFKVNIPKEYASVSLKKYFSGKFNISGNELLIELPPHSFEIITTR